MTQETNSVVLWNRCLAFIRDNVQESTFKTWFEPIVPYKYENDTLFVKVPSQFFYEFLDEHFMELLRAALYKEIGEGTRLMYKAVVDQEGEKTTDVEATDRSTAILPRTVRGGNLAPSTLDAQPAIQDLDSHLNPNYNFHNFIEGISNKLSRTAGEAVAKDPAKTIFNPLFIWGPSGVGKTHLVNAIGTRIRELHPEKRVLYVSAHLFQVQYTDSVRRNTTNDFIHFYQTIDVLIMDDIQEFAGSVKTQNTFFHIFNHLHLSGKQLILTADRPPMMLQGMEDRLLTRFKWGLQAELEKPTVDLRRDILNNKIHRDGLTIPANVVDYIAENVNDSVRDLEGILISIMAHSTVYNKEIDIDLAARIVKKSIRVEARKITIDEIIEKVCAHYKMSQDVIHSRSRKRDVVNARQIAMFLAKKYTDESSSRIGQYIGQRDHATVIHACKSIQGQYEVDKNFQVELEEVEQSFKR